MTGGARGNCVIPLGVGRRQGLAGFGFRAFPGVGLGRGRRAGGWARSGMGIGRGWQHRALWTGGVAASEGESLEMLESRARELEAQLEEVRGQVEELRRTA